MSALALCGLAYLIARAAIFDRPRRAILSLAAVAPEWATSALRCPPCAAGQLGLCLQLASLVGWHILGGPFTIIDTLGGIALAWAVVANSRF